MANTYPTNPMNLLGRSFHFRETLSWGETCWYQARVIAVQVPCPGTDVEWALLLERPGTDEPSREYVDLDRLTFEWGGVTPLQPIHLNPIVRH